MNKKQRANLIMIRLSEKYPNPPIPLYHINEYTLLIAVLLSAQSTDKKVNELTKELFKIASKPKEMYVLGKERIYGYINNKYINKISMSPTIIKNYVKEN